MDNIETIYEKIRTLSKRVVDTLAEKGKLMASAESCTGGMISGAITSVAGSSAVIELGVCSYSNRIKAEVLGVSEKTLQTYTEYSVQCAEEMAKGVMKAAGSDYGVSTTGIAGPLPLNEEHPAGDVCIAVCSADKCVSKRYLFGDHDRDYIRAVSTLTALEMLYEMI